MSEDDRRGECERADYQYKEAKKYFDWSKENYATAHQEIREDEAKIHTKNAVIDDINRKLYYLNDKISSKTSKIEDLKAERDREKGRDEKDRDESRIRDLQNQIEEHARERKGFESDRDDAVGEREKVKDRIKELEQDIGKWRRVLSDNKDAMSQHREKMKAARRHAEEYCDSTSGFDIPDLPSSP